MNIFNRVGKIIKAEVEGFLEKENINKKDNQNFSFEKSYNDDFSDTYEYTKKELEYFANLELKPGATFNQIKDAYRRMQKDYHPDRHQLDPQKKEIANQIIKKINEAYKYFENKHKEK